MKLWDYINEDFLRAKSSQIREIRALDNGKTVRVLCVSSILISLLLIVQNVVSPGLPEGSIIKLLYIVSFTSVAVISFICYLFLTFIANPHIIRMLTNFYGFTATLMTTTLTLIDLAHIKDYSAYCFGLMTLPLFIRASLATYIAIIAVNFTWFLFGYHLMLNEEIDFNTLAPIIAFSIGSLFASVVVERARLKGNFLQLELEESNRNLRELSHKDQLTGLYNRRHLMEALQTMVSAANRYDFPVSALLLDLDHFKKTNDSFGHQVGDRLLARIGGLLFGLVRDCDIAARYGGEEFCIILTNTAKDGALFVAERIRNRIESETFEGIPWNVTVSIGVSMREPNQSVEDFLRIADEKLYESKSAGRNRISA
ncbi:diguanylate cyclase (GGDEF) domain protein [Leptospira inadai serovar Lyme str. 10]|uniref:diguanylate cyclase n=2 Tax=Leptospira inadai serovar Lyme TaxID=293084 RepID=V6HBK1_9LEPT|nr:GGDEF domain-containing protein [Leptospira inadai]EQA36008.1 diguanylate cyclase (GGDEF) domain protein [Leptospira inadai serovar Lyme str. 10]PNV76962.1 GGDEF domain-containing protein [Leptospira inadai serovar Lyme]